MHILTYVHIMCMSEVYVTLVRKKVGCMRNSKRAKFQRDKETRKKTVYPGLDEVTTLYPRRPTFNLTIYSPRHDPILHISLSLNGSPFSFFFLSTIHFIPYFNVLVHFPDASSGSIVIFPNCLSLNRQRGYLNLLVEEKGTSILFTTFYLHSRLFIQTEFYKI